MDAATGDAPDQSDGSVSAPKDTGSPAAPDASAPGLDGPPVAPDLASADLAAADLAVLPDLAAPRDLATAVDLGPDAPPSPCPGGPPPPGYGFTCGCAAGGKIRCDGTCSVPDDTCIPTGEYYYLTTMFLGDGRRLDTYNSPTADAFMATMTGFSGQMWGISRAEDGTYRLHNMFGGPTRPLQANPDGSKLFLGMTGDVPAQKWRIRAAGPGFFRLTNLLHGAARSLDCRNDGVNDPFMNTTGDYSGQLWLINEF